MKKLLTIICDIDVPVSDLLDHERFDVIKTEKEDVFAMTKKEKVGQTFIFPNSTGTYPPPTNVTYTQSN